MVRLLTSFKWAAQGLKFCLSREKNFQVHCFIGALAIVTGFTLGISAMEWVVISTCIAVVLAFEMINTAIEHLCNIARPSIDPTVKIIKDVSAGAVLIIAIMSVVCGAIIFIPKVIAIL